MSKMKHLDPMPQEFRSYEEAGEFWDTHDTTQYSTDFTTIQNKEKAEEISKYWKNSSVLRLAAGRDPIKAITQKAQDLVFRALEQGWSGPPFDPFALAQMLKIKVVPRDDIREARTVPDPSGGLIIEYNPIRNASRTRYSICHEIAHSLFPDCAERVRNRLSHEQMQGTDWQLEMLCNLGAAELLMPIGSFPEMSQAQMTIDQILVLRKKFEVSTEAVLLRTVKLADEPIAAFSAAVAREGPSSRRYAVEYCVSSKGWVAGFRPGLTLPEATAIAKCTAVGYTSKGVEVWKDPIGAMEVECVGVPPYPNQIYPRVVGLLKPTTHTPSGYPTVTYLKRDATEPIDPTPTIIAHIVNDKTPNWGAGFGHFLAKKWPEVQDRFRNVTMGTGNLKLGKTFLSEVSAVLAVFHMISQHGYGASAKPRIRYEPLRYCLEQLAESALSRRAKVQMPRIGAGEAGGSWPVIEEMIEDTLCRRGIAVTVCDLPGAKVKEPVQPELIEGLGRTA